MRVSRNGRTSTVLASSGRSGRASPSWIQAAPANTYTFYLYDYAGRVQGKLLDSVKVTGRAPPKPAPKISRFSASPTTIDKGKSSTLSWSVTNATSLSISPGIGTVSTSGSRSVSPSSTTTYTLTATNSVKSVKATAKVTVQPPTPTVSGSISASPNPCTIAAGKSTCTTTLTWSGTGTSGLRVRVSRNGRPSTVVSSSGASGSASPSWIQAAPAHTYTFYLYDYAGRVQGKLLDSVKVTGRAPQPAPKISSFTASPERIGKGERSTLRWSTSNADTLSISPGIGTLTDTQRRVYAIRPLRVSPSSTTTYTLTATNSTGSVEATAKVTVGAPRISGTISVGTLNPCAIETGTDTCTAKIQWTVKNTKSVKVYVSANGGTATLFATASGDGSRDATGIRGSPNTYVFHLYDYSSGSRGSLLDSVTVTGRRVPTATFTANPTTIDQGESSTLSWSTSNADSVFISPGVGSVSAQGTRKVSPNSTTTYTLNVTNKARSVKLTVKVEVRKTKAPAISSFTASPAAIDKGKSATLRWSTTDADTLSITPGIGTLSDAQRRAYAVRPLRVSPLETTTYTLTATNRVKSVTATAKVTVRKPTKAPTIGSFTANPGAIDKGKSATLRWSTTDADTLSITPGIGTLTDSQRQLYERVGLRVSPSATTTYTLKATNRVKSVTATAKVTVRKPTLAPTIGSFAASPTRIDKGKSSTLSWSTTNADTLSIAPDVGEVTGTSVKVSPSVTTTYVLTATNSFTSVRASTKVTVGPPGPAPKIVYFLAMPSKIDQGQFTTLRWGADNADSVSLSPDVGQDIGKVSTRGFRKVSPSVTTTYTLTATNATKSVEAELTVTVRGPPTIGSFTADPTRIDKGKSSTLRWSTTDADTLSITPGIGTLTDSERRIYRAWPLRVSPAETTTYTLKATNAAGSVEATVKVTVRNPNLSGEISVSPNPCTIYHGETGCTPTVTWKSKGATSVQVWYSLNKGEEEHLASSDDGGPYSKKLDVKLQATDSIAFRLYDYSSGTRDELLAELPEKSLTIQEDIGCPPASN